MISQMPARERLDSAAEILGLDPHEADPVMIIVAAQLRLRRCRQFQATGNRLTSLEVQQISAARDALLARAIGVFIQTGRERLAEPPSSSAGQGSAERQLGCEHRYHPGHDMGRELEEPVGADDGRAGR